MSELHLVIDCRNILGEGLTWDHAARRLYWVDIEASVIWSLDPATGRTSAHKAPERVACLAPRRGGDGAPVGQRGVVVDHEHTVGRPADVELDPVGPHLGRPPERRERVLPDAGALRLMGAAVGQDEHGAILASRTKNRAEQGRNASR